MAPDILIVLDVFYNSNCFHCMMYVSSILESSLFYQFYFLLLHTRIEASSPFSPDTSFETPSAI